MKLLDRLAEKLREATSVYGFTCDNCGAEVFEYPRRRFCDECIAKLRFNDGKKCEKCGRSTVADGICLNCKSDAPTFKNGVSPFVYRGSTAALVNRIKNGNRRLSLFFGEEMAAAFLHRFPEIGRNGESIVIVPVPMTEESLAKRGYNQAEELGVTVAKALNAAGVAASVDKEILVKRREVKAQKQLHFFERTQNVRGAYHVHKRTACKEKTILLVDDIMTTGATGNECAQTLLNAGAKEVYFLVAASLPELK
ncbi:MAG: ComF family protein [Clostridia bacterium]|nr:ComF family protein [Clostridia bacterium]